MYVILFLIFIIFILFFGYLISSIPPHYDSKITSNKYPYDKLLIVAHPDDESLWAFNHLKNIKGWKVICVTNGMNKIRRKEFQNAMNYFGCNYEMWSYLDFSLCYNWSNKIYKDLDLVINQDENIKEVYTHNPQGEYGHIQHIKVNNVVLDVSKKPTYVFQYSSKKGNMNLDKINFNVYQSQKKIWKHYAEKNITEKMVRLI